VRHRAHRGRRDKHGYPRGDADDGRAVKDRGQHDAYLQHHAGNKVQRRKRAGGKQGQEHFHPRKPEQLSGLHR